MTDNKNDFDFSVFDDMFSNIPDSSVSSHASLERMKSDTGISGDLLDEINAIAKGKSPGTTENENKNSGMGMTTDSCDAEIKITEKGNSLEANICVYSPQLGGKDVTLEAIKNAINRKGIVYGIDEEILENIVSEKLYDTIFPFAHGDPAVDGEDGHVTPRYDEVKKLRPKILEDGSVDYRDLGMVVNIKVGDAICDIKNETPGVSGKDIYGKVIYPTPGKPPVIPSGSNTAVNGDHSLLIALASGNLIFQNGKFSVETVFTVRDNVDISTGNINFMGDVIIKGNVEEGFIVCSEKDITVHGMLNGATLKCEGNILVKNGAVNSTVISTGGNVTLGFGENCKIKCKGNFRSNSLVSCIAEVEGNMECVSNTGTIVGGAYKVMGSVVCNTLGHRNYIATNISVGNFATLIEEQFKLEDKIAQYDADIQKINLSVEFLQNEKKETGKLSKEKEDFINAAVRLKVQKTLEKKQLQKRIMEIDTLVTKSENLTIRVNRFLHPNVKINMEKHTIQTTEERGKCVIFATKNGIVIS